MHKSIAWGLGLASLLAAGALVAMTTAPPNLERALEAQQRLAQEQPFDADVFNDLGNLLLLDHRPAEAEEAYRKAVELDPERIAAHFNLGLLLQQTGRGREALKQFRIVLERDPDHAWAHYQVGAIHERAGDKGSAIRHYSRAFALDPQLASVDVNPQIIENELVVESMLRGYREMNRRPLAPKTYDDRTRIASLMVSTDESASGAGVETAGEAAASKAEAGGELTPDPQWSDRGRRPPTAVAGEPVAGGVLQDDREIEEDSGEGAVRVLTPDTIERGGTLGQAMAPGSGRSSRDSRSSGRVDSRSRSRSSSSLPTIGGSSTRAPRTTSRPGGVRYVPSVRSTGSLDLDLVPRLPHPLDPAAQPAG